MTQVLGRAFIKVNGKTLPSHKGAKLNMGGISRKGVVGHEVHGYAESMEAPMLECEVSLRKGDKLSDYDLTDATIVFEADTGQSYVIRNGWKEDTNQITDGEGGKIPLKFSGLKCEEL